MGGPHAILSLVAEVWLCFIFREDGVVCLVKPAEHAVGQCLQVGSVGLELVRQPFVFVHPFSSLLFFSRESDAFTFARPLVTFFRCIPSL